MVSSQLFKLQLVDNFIIAQCDGKIQVETTGNTLVYVVRGEAFGNILIVLMDKQLVLKPSKLDFKLLIYSLKYGLQNSDILQLLEGKRKRIRIRIKQSFSQWFLMLMRYPSRIKQRKTAEEVLSQESIMMESKSLMFQAKMLASALVHAQESNPPLNYLKSAKTQFGEVSLYSMEDLTSSQLHAGDDFFINRLFINISLKTIIITILNKSLPIYNKKKSKYFTKIM